MADKLNTDELNSDQIYIEMDKLNKMAYMNPNESWEHISYEEMKVAVDAVDAKYYLECNRQSETFGDNVAVCIADAIETVVSAFGSFGSFVPSKKVLDVKKPPTNGTNTSNAYSGGIGVTNYHHFTIIDDHF
jgi:hypothetical protein